MTESYQSAIKNLYMKKIKQWQKYKIIKTDHKTNKTIYYESYAYIKRR